MTASGLLRRGERAVGAPACHPPHPENAHGSETKRRNNEARHRQRQWTPLLHIGDRFAASMVRWWMSGGCQSVVVLRLVVARHSPRERRQESMGWGAGASADSRLPPPHLFTQNPRFYRSLCNMRWRQGLPEMTCHRAFSRGGRAVRAPARGGEDAAGGSRDISRGGRGVRRALGVVALCL